MVLHNFGGQLISLQFETFVVPRLPGEVPDPFIELFHATLAEIFAAVWAVLGRLNKL